MSCLAAGPPAPKGWEAIAVLSTARKSTRIHGCASIGVIWAKHRPTDASVPHQARQHGPLRSRASLQMRTAEGEPLTWHVTATVNGVDERALLQQARAHLTAHFVPGMALPIKSIDRLARLLVQVMCALV